MSNWVEDKYGRLFDPITGNLVGHINPVTGTEAMTPAFNAAGNVLLNGTVYGAGTGPLGKLIASAQAANTRGILAHPTVTATVTASSANNFGDISIEGNLLAPQTWPPSQGSATNSSSASIFTTTPLRTYNGVFQSDCSTATQHFPMYYGGNGVNQIISSFHFNGRFLALLTSGGSSSVGAVFLDGYLVNTWAGSSGNALTNNWVLFDFGAVISGAITVSSLCLAAIGTTFDGTISDVGGTTPKALVIGDSYAPFKCTNVPISCGWMQQALSMIGVRDFAIDAIGGTGYVAGSHGNALAFTAAPVAGSTSATLTSAYGGNLTSAWIWWAASTGDGEARLGTVANGSTAVSWSPPLTNTQTTTAVYIDQQPNVLQRLPNDLTNPLIIGTPDLVLIAMGINDPAWANATQFEAQVASCLSLIRSAWPNAVIAALGPYCADETQAPQNQPAGSTAYVRAGILAAMQAITGPWIFIDNLYSGWQTSAGTSDAGSGRSWQTGQGTTLTLTAAPSAGTGTGGLTLATAFQGTSTGTNGGFAVFQLANGTGYEAHYCTLTNGSTTMTLNSNLSNNCTVNCGYLFGVAVPHIGNAWEYVDGTNYPHLVQVGYDNLSFKLGTALRAALLSMRG